jgi:hypothetical protein
VIEGGLALTQAHWKGQGPSGVLNFEQTISSFTGHSVGHSTDGGSALTQAHPNSQFATFSKSNVQTAPGELKHAFSEPSTSQKFVYGSLVLGRQSHVALHCSEL